MCGFRLGSPFRGPVVGVHVGVPAGRPPSPGRPDDEVGGAEAAAVVVRWGVHSEMMWNVVPLFHIDETVGITRSSVFNGHSI